MFLRLSKIASKVLKKKRQATLKWKRSFLCLYHKSARFFTNILRTVLYLFTRPLARLFIYTGSLKIHMKKNLKSVQAKRRLLIDFGGEPLTLLTQDKRRIDGMYFSSGSIFPEKQIYTNQARQTVIFCLGNSLLYENCIDMISFYLKHDLNVMVFNYGGYGKSQGPVTVKNTCHDVEAAYKYIREIQRVEDYRIIVHGFSIGGGPATHLAAKHPIGLVLDRTYADLGSIVGGLLGRATNYLYPYNNHQKLNLVKGNIHIIEAAQDEIMSRHHAETLFQEIIHIRHPEAFGSEIDQLRKQYITVIPASGHTDCWLADIMGIYANEQDKFFESILSREQQQLSNKDGYIQKMWKRIVN